MGTDDTALTLTTLQSSIISHLADGAFHSGTRLGQIIGVSRAAVCKAIAELTRFGLEVNAVKGRGYRLPMPLQLLNVEQLLLQLSAHNRQHLASIHVLQVVDSTNAYLMRYTGAPVACLAEYQTTGRGRRGRQWVSPFGTNIYLSLRWRFDDGMGRLAGLSLAAGVAVLRALTTLGIEGAGLKWPNDIYWSGRKLGGILLEVTGESAGPCHVVIGVGINVHMSRGTSREIDQPWASLVSIQPSIQRNALAGLILNHLMDVMVSFERHGLHPFEAEWRHADVFADRKITLQLPDEQMHGICRGIDHDGALLLEVDGSIRRYTYGEVSVRLAEVEQ